MLRPLPTERERDRHRVLPEDREEMVCLERMFRPLSLTDMLEKEGWRSEKLRMERVEAMVSTAAESD